MSQLTDRYAFALYELALEMNALKDWQKQAKLISNSLDEDMHKFFSSRLVSDDDKKKVLHEAFSNVDQMILNFMDLLIDKGRFSYILKILASFNTKCNEYFHVKEGIVYSSRKLSDDQIKMLETALQNKYSYEVELINKIDVTLISGVKVEIEGQVYDASMKKSINNLKMSLLDER